jgi:hypothetical protein
VLVDVGQCGTIVDEIVEAIGVAIAGWCVEDVDDHRRVGRRDETRVAAHVLDALQLAGADAIARTAALNRRAVTASQYSDEDNRTHAASRISDR